MAPRSHGPTCSHATFLQRPWLLRCPADPWPPQSAPHAALVRRWHHRRSWRFQKKREHRDRRREGERVCTCRKLKLLEIVWTLAYWYCTLVPCYFWLEIKPRFQCGNMKQNLVPFVQWVAPSLISIRCLLSTSIHWYEKCILFSYSNRVSACVHCMCTAA